MMASTRREELEQRLLKLYRQYVGARLSVIRNWETLRLGGEEQDDSERVVEDLLMLEDELAAYIAEQTPHPGDKRWLKQPTKKSRRQTERWGYHGYYRGPQGSLFAQDDDQESEGFAES